MNIFTYLYSSPSSFTHVHRCIGSPNATRQTMLLNAYLSETDVSKYVWQEEWHNPVYPKKNSNGNTFWVFHHTDSHI